VATKIELAEAMTIAQLRVLADEHGVDLSGLTAKADIAEAIAAGVSKADLEGGESVSEEEPAVQEDAAEEGAAPDAAARELSGPAAIPGENIVKKVNPETPSQAQIDAASGDVPGPPVTELTITDADGNATQYELRPDDAALISQRAVAQQHDNPIFTGPGHGSSDAVAREASETEVEADQKAYEERLAAAE
jgi:hypothetical protein